MSVLSSQPHATAAGSIISTDRRHQQCCARSVTRSGTCRAAPLPLRCTRRAKGGGTRDAAEGYVREGAIAGSGPCTGACASKFRDQSENRKASHHFDSVGGSFIRSRVIVGLSMYLRSRAVAAVSLSFTYSNSLAPVKTRSAAHERRGKPALSVAVALAVACHR